jgi:imidazole glycerol-phosphate synthase subunit HisH
MIAAIVDYGSGNLRSVAKAFERAALGSAPKAKVMVTSDPKDLASASHIILPGVGAFADCRRGLLGVDGMDEALEDAIINRGRPFLGICVGMQLLADVGREHGDYQGLGWIPGEVRALEPKDKALKIPHMGWNDLAFNGVHPVLEGLDEGLHTYFVHSYQFVCAKAEHCLATVDYGGSVAAVVGRDNILGTQFHPEKSQAVGLKLIKNFLNWRP